jgi:predicted nucleic acid-binding protein
VAHLRYLVDTNVLLRWVNPGAKEYLVARSAIHQLRNAGSTLCYASQNLGEFWNVLTRPVTANGYGLTPQESDQRAHEIESRLQLLPDGALVHQEWRRMLVAHGISGVKVHDSRLMASMRVHGVRDFLTFNTRDFARFTDIRAVAPAEVAPNAVP